MFKHRRHRRNRYKKNTKIIVISVSVLVLFISVGYAAFTTNIDLHIKGNIVKYTVTFDPNGGNLDTTSKVVTYHDTYGQLPTPTREGYTFKGWHGKNKIQYYKLSISMINAGITVDNNGNISDTTPDVDHREWNFSYHHGWEEYLQAGNYSLSLIFSRLSTIGDNRIVVRGSDETTYCSSSIDNISDYTCNFELLSSDYISVLIKGYDGIYKIQLEEGDTATEYEPYYVTSDTTVVQKKDHTLTAIWEENTP